MGGLRSSRGSRNCCPLQRSTTVTGKPLLQCVCFGERTELRSPSLVKRSVHSRGPNRFATTVEPPVRKGRVPCPTEVTGQVTPLTPAALTSPGSGACRLAGPYPPNPCRGRAGRLTSRLTGPLFRPYPVPTATLFPRPSGPNRHGDWVPGTGGVGTPTAREGCPYWTETRASPGSSVTGRDSEV